MAIATDNLKVIIRGVLLGQQFENIQWYRLEGAAFLTATPVGVGEAYWNDIKTVWRAAMYADGVNLRTNSVFVAEAGAAGQYGEYAIPSAEQVGTRSVSGSGDLMPPFACSAVRLTVGSRVTRPGQKRFVGLAEQDNNAGLLGATLKGLVDALAAKFDSMITLGAPVATGVMYPEIVRLDSAGNVSVRQDITGHLTSVNVSTQNSRKFGRGT